MNKFFPFSNLSKNGVLNYEKLHLEYIPNFLTSRDSYDLFKIFKNSIQWKNDRFKIMGKNYEVKRKVALYGDKDIFYKYSGSKKLAIPWTKSLTNIKNQIKNKNNYDFNSVLLNSYDNGDVYMGWHSDDEKELGTNPLIASISLGESRDFLFKHKYDSSLKKIKINLSNGSLLLMKGRTQHFWNHCLPKRRLIDNERINLTFRNIMN